MKGDRGVTLGFVIGWLVGFSAVEVSYDEEDDS